MDKPYVKIAILLLLAINSASLSMQSMNILSDLRLGSVYLLMITAGLFIILYFFFFQQRLEFWHTFFHELTHLLFAIITFNKVHHFQASFNNGGNISYEGRGNWLISLSPYFFPVHTMIIVMLGSWMMPETRAFVRQLVVISYTFFGITVFKQFSFSQPDIRKTGSLFSALIVVQMNALILLFIVFYFQGDSNLLFNRILWMMQHMLDIILGAV